MSQLLEYKKSHNRRPNPKIEKSSESDQSSSQSSHSESGSQASSESKKEYSCTPVSEGNEEILLSQATPNHKPNHRVRGNHHH